MSFAGVGLGLGLAGAGLQAYGTYEQGQATAAAERYQAQVAQNNAIIAEQNAQYAMKSGYQSAETQSRRGAAIGGRIKAAQAANNIDVNTGSAVDVQAGQRQTAQLDTETTLNRSALQAYGYRAQKTSYEAQAGLDTAEAGQAVEGADIGAIGGLVGNASGLAFKYAQLG